MNHFTTDQVVLTLLVLAGSSLGQRVIDDVLASARHYTYQAIACDTVASALQQIRQEPPDILLVEAGSNIESGLELLRQIRRYLPFPRMAVILLSDQEAIDTALQVMKAGAQDYLIYRTLTPHRLQQAIEAARSQLNHAHSLMERDHSPQQLMAGIALRIRQSLQLEEILSTTADEVRQFLKTDRVLVFQFHPDMSGTIVAESVLPGWTVSLGRQVEETYFKEKGAIAYQQGRKQILENIEQADLAECHVQFLQQFEVKAILVVPILVNGALWGLLVAHHCATVRTWQLEEVDLLETLAVQIAIAIQQASAYEQAKTELAERIQIEKHLRDSEERFRNTFEQAAVGLAHVLPQGRFIRLNQRFCDITGYSSIELLSLTFQEITHPDDLVTDLRQMQNLLLGKIQTFSVEKRCIRKNRAIVWINLTLSLVRDPSGKPKYFISVIEDISIRKQAEAERLQAEKVRLELKLLDDILDTILAGYWDADIANQKQYISPGFKRMFGYEDHELTNSPNTWKELVFPEDLPKAMASFENHVQSHGQIPYYNELRYRHKNGSTVWVMCSGRVIAWDDQGHPLRMIGCHIEITKLKEAEAALTKSAAEIQDLYNNAPCGYHSLDPHGRIININDTELQWLGYDREEVIGQPFTRFITPEGIQMFETHYPQFQQRGWEKDREFDLVCKDGTIFPVLVSATAVMSADGTYLHSRSTLFDLRDRKQAELQLRQMNQQLAQTNVELARATRMKDEFLANMSHELRTPLNAILGMSESLLEEILGPLNENQQSAIATLERSGEHLLGLINDILDLSKIEAGKLELDLAPVSINHLCQSSLSFVKQQALKKQIQLQLSLPPALRDMRLDERRMRQVLINLLTNAVKFTPTGGNVTLEVQYATTARTTANEAIGICQSSTSEPPPAQPQIPYLCISVIDTGIGIAPTDQAKLFQPFVQIDSALNRQYDGTGLGLVLVKRIVELHEGEIHVQSIPHQGSCFTVCLPDLEPFGDLTPSPAPLPVPVNSVPQANPATPIDGNIPPPAIDAPLILLAEDNEANITTIANYLQAKGFRLLIATNGEEVITLLHTHHPDLVLMDIQMPKVDGLTAMKLMRQDPEFATIPIIALTALAMKEDRERCLAAGANDYLAKPVSLKQLTETIHAHLATIV